MNFKFDLISSFDETGSHSQDICLSIRRDLSSNSTIISNRLTNSRISIEQQPNDDMRAQWGAIERINFDFLLSILIRLINLGV